MAKKQPTTGQIALDGTDVILAAETPRGWTMVTTESPDNAVVGIAAKAVNKAIWSAPSFGLSAIELAHRANRILVVETPSVFVVAR